MKASAGPTFTADQDSDAAATPFHSLTGLVQTMPLQVLPMRGALEPDAAAIDLQHTELELFPRNIGWIRSLFLNSKADFSAALKVLALGAKVERRAQKLSRPVAIACAVPHLHRGVSATKIAPM